MCKTYKHKQPKWLESWLNGLQAAQADQKIYVKVAWGSTLESWSNDLWKHSSKCHKAKIEESE